MSGHSKWSNIKHRKQAQDVKRSKIFQKLSKEILISIKNGGANVDYNSGLRNILSKAKSLNMPKSRIDALIKTASSKKEQVHFEEILYEAYLPGGVAVIIESITDNKNRTTPVVKTAISKVNGNLSPSGSVVRLFHRKGLFNFENNLELDENAVFEKIIDLQIDELTVSEDSIQILTLPEHHNECSRSLENIEIGTLTDSEIIFVPNTFVSENTNSANKIERLRSLLDDNEDIEEIYTNYPSN